MTLGIGTDIVRISRIERSLQKNPQMLAKRILTSAEFEKFLCAVKPSAYLAKRFAAKEAASKALGTGIGKISWQDLEVVNAESGAPALRLYGKAMHYFEQMGGRAVHLSLSDEDDLALAFVVIS